MQNRDFSRALLGLQERASDVEGFSRNIGRWFNDGMEMVSGAYKRRTQWRLLALAALVMVALNVDTLNVLNRLSSDSAVRESLVAQAQALSAARPTSAASQASSTAFDDALSQLTSLGMPIGWTARNSALWSASRTSTPKAVAFQILGWILTALAVSLGAPFWFDLLNNVMVVRSTVKPREKSGEERPKG